MTIHQVVDIRTAGPRRYFATEQDELAFHARIAAARAAIPSHVRYAVAPDQQVRARDGSWLQAGAHIQGSDDLWVEAGQVAWQVLRDLVWRETVIESYSYTPPEVA